MKRSPKPEPFVVALLQKYVDGAGSRIVDVGCGPAVYRDATDAEYIGVDYRSDPYGGDSDVDVVAPAEDLPFDDASVDLVLTKSALYQFRDPDAALREFHRVLRPGGRIVVVDYNRRTQRRLERLEGAPRPKWTALGLRRRVRRAGFGSTELLVPGDLEGAGVRRVARLAREELRGQWAIVTGIRRS